MKKLIYLQFIFFFLMLIFSESILFAGTKGDTSGWKAGVSKVVITPEQPMWMAGYAARSHPAGEALHDLWAKALILEDTTGKRALLITTDLESFPKYLSDRIRDRIGKTYGLTRAQIILSSSHTHSGPVLQGMYNCYTEDSRELNRIRDYSVKLEEKIISLAGKAIHSMKPAQLYSQNGITRFQVNTRNNKESSLTGLTELKGPNDYSVPVMKVVDRSGKLMAVAFGYACHNTTLDGYKWCGDYAGFAQLELEKLHPGTAAMFFQGAGGDQNPLPRSTVALAQQYGRELAAAVERVLNEEMQKLSPGISAAYSEIQLELSNPPSKEVLTGMIKKSSGYVKRWAEQLLNKMQNGGAIPTIYPYPVQIWKLGEQPVFSLGGEVVVEYSIELKKIFGNDIFVLGYCNDVMAYIPSDTILKEGGYEGDTSMIAFGLPAPWKSNVETLIIEEVKRLAKQIEVPLGNSLNDSGKYKHEIRVISGSGKDAHELLPHVHLVDSLVKRRINGTNQGSISPKYLS